MIYEEEMIDITLPDQLLSIAEEIGKEKSISKEEAAKKILNALSEKTLKLLRNSDHDSFNPDKFALAFVSMTFIFHKLELDSWIPSKRINKTIADILERIEQEDLQAYLKLIPGNTLEIISINKAIEIYPSCAIAYYLKVLALLQGKISSLKDVTYENRQEIFDCCEKKMKDLRMLLRSPSEGLLGINDEFMGNEDNLNFDKIYEDLKNAHELDETTYDLNETTYALNETDQQLKKYKSELEEQKTINAQLEKLQKELPLETRWENIDSRIEESFGPIICGVFSKRTEIMNVLRTGEFFWLNFLGMMKLEIIDKQSVIDLTPFAVSYFKMVEMYLFEKVFEQCQKKTFDDFYEGIKILEMNRSAIKSKSTISTLRRNISNHRGFILKNPNKKDYLVGIIKDWADSTRNAKLHTRTIDSINELEKIKKATKEVLLVIIEEFK